jgi:hypothetical protein
MIKIMPRHDFFNAATFKKNTNDKQTDGLCDSGITIQQAHHQQQHNKRRDDEK